MHTFKSFSIALLLTSASACGGGDGGSESSGVETSRSVISLSESEGTGLCEWAADVQGGAGTSHECGDSVTVDVQTASECWDTIGALEDCAMTVGQFEACSLALADDPCGFGGPACAPLFDCF